MSIIQDIRDKYARIAVIAIALALVGFILTDYFAGRGQGSMSGGSKSVGAVNGKSINYVDFNKKVEAAKAQTENMYKQQGYPVNSAAIQQQAVEQTWNQEITRMLFQSEFDKLGMRIGKKEKGDILYGPNAPDVIKQAGSDENGNYDPLKAKQQVDQMMKNKQVPQEQKDDFNRYITELEDQRKSEKYMALFANSTNYPRWYVEKQIADNSLIANISMVRVLYSDSMFVDSTIAISDKEIVDYVNKHKDKFKQEESRGINYVAFSASPTATDSAAIRNQVITLKQEFDTTKELTNFLLRNGGSEPSDMFSNASQLPAMAKDSIIRLPKNGVYGPFIAGSNYVLAKLLDSKTLPDSVKARHILIKTYDPQQQQQVLDDSIGKRRIDSIETAIKGGAPFELLAMKYSDDKGSGANGGLLETPIYQGGPTSPYFGQGAMVKEFNDFSFEGKKGERKVVKTVFGYHLIEILDQKNFEPHYKMAYLAKEIIASKETDDSAVNAANMFFGDSHDQKSFDATFEKTLKPKKINKGIAVDIKPLDADVRGLGASRIFVKNIYAAKLGEVLKPERIGNDYVVAVVTVIDKEGTMSVAKARPLVEPLLRNKKKVEQIKQKFGKITTLEAAATAVNKPVEKIDSLRMSILSQAANLGFEPKIRGAAFNPANKGKVVPEAIEGVSGVYVIRVDNVSATASTEGSVADQRKKKYDDSKNMPANPIEALKKAATIKDKRAERY